MIKEVFVSTEYITLAQFLKFAGIIANGGEAKMFLATNKILVNGELENRRGRKLYPGFKIEINNLSYVVKNDFEAN